MNDKIKQVEEKYQEKKEIFSLIKNEMAKAIVGQNDLVHKLLLAILCRGHFLLEGVPGLAKTTAVTALANIFDAKFRRIQFTPDLLPSDLIGSRIFNQKDNSFFVKKGPIFANFVLADEINRSPAKVQSALLEAMQEKQVTIGEETFSIPDPFFVMATENPIEQEGTYLLPEAQVDRFIFKTVIDYPSQEEELRIIELIEKSEQGKSVAKLTINDILELQKLATQVYMDESIKKYITDIVQTSRKPCDIKLDDNKLDDMILYGASPRASIFLMKAGKANALLAGRGYVIPEDIKSVSMDVLRHRVLPSYEAEAENIKSEDIVKIILNNVKVP
jgi:MoxR-like ATPase